MELHSQAAEQAVLGGLLIHPDAIDRVYWLPVEAFYTAAHRNIYRAIRMLLDDNKPVDMVAVAEVLDRHGKLNEAGGIMYLGELVKNTPGATNIRAHAETVQERATLRSLAGAIQGIQEDISSPGDVQQKLERAQAAVMAISERAQTDEPTFVGDMLLERMERFEQMQEGKIKMLSTGLKDLDAALGGGLEPGNMIVLAARPSMGKTALALQVAEAVQANEHVRGAALVFSLEMTKGQLTDRMICGNARVTLDQMKSGQMDDDDWQRVSFACGRLKEMNLMIDDLSTTLAAMRAKARTAKRKYGLSCIVVDYLQLMEFQADGREQQIAGISRGLKALAKEMGVPLIALSQLSRKVEERTNKRPIMSDLRESGAIEQDADVIMFIYRDEYYNPDTSWKGVAEVIIAKNRNGPAGKSVPLHFEGAYTRFGNFIGDLPQQPSPVKRRGSFGFDD
jgi:replicative DNA helicase